MDIVFTEVEHAGIKATYNDVILGWVCTSINDTWVFLNSVSGETSDKLKTKEEAFDYAEKIINRMVNKASVLAKAINTTYEFDIGQIETNSSTDIEIPEVGETFKGKMVLLIHDNGVPVEQDFGMGEAGVLVEQELSVEITKDADSLRFYGFIQDLERKFLNSFIKVETRQIKS